MRHTMHRMLVIGTGIGLCVLCLASAAFGGADETTLIQWRFDKPGDFQGWTIGGLIADAAVRDGALHGRATGSDPIMFAPTFELAAAPTQFVEVCLKGTAPSVAELYWTETLAGQYGGFSPEKYRKLYAQGDGQYHVYRVWPFWHAAKKIIRLRFDPPNAGEFDIQWIRIGQRRGITQTSAKSWNAQQFQEQWFASGEYDGDSKSPILLSPLLAIDAAENPFVCVRMSTRQPGSGRLYCVSSSQYGWESISFPLRADGQTHSYNIAVNGLKRWQGTITALALQLPGSSHTDGGSNRSK